ncbi:MAG: ParB N-terminal domain-containing protein [Rhodospirillaceae bacterium]|nr:ParB N-terminal domain-containing protein [Rhodospirillaceae bacterium]
MSGFSLRKSDGRTDKRIEWRRLDTLSPPHRNPRTHSAKQVEQIAASIREFGFVNPILIDEASRILAGNGRAEAARKLGLKEVPTLLIGHMTAAQKRAYVIADNRIAEQADWDRSLLSLELEELQALGFEVELTGFSTAEIDLLLDDSSKSEASDPDDVTPLPKVQAVSRVGDVWSLGPHRIICGDALDRATYDAVLPGELAQMVFTDPPFNVKIRGHVSSSKRIAHREFAMASGEMSPAAFVRFLGKAFRLLISTSVDGSIHFICMDWRHVGEMLEASQGVYHEFKNICVWAKTNAGMGSFYRSQHELVFVFKNGAATHINNFGLGDKGRYRTNVWQYPGVNSADPRRRQELEMHPTVKPTALVADAIRDCSRRDGLILDPFGGSGTTILAAERTGRRARLIEIDPIYVDVAIRRWQDRTGGQATLTSTGQTFEKVFEQRCAALEKGRARS